MIFDLYHFRKAQAARATDVFAYDKIPPALRVQVVMILKDALGVHPRQGAYMEGFWEPLRSILCREFGVFSLCGERGADEDVRKFLVTTNSVDEFLSTVEAAFRIVEKAVPQDVETKSVLEISQGAEEAVNELNQRFLRAGLGYQYNDGIVIRVDNAKMHREVILPALAFLADARFAGANDEFRAAHEHYRAGEYKDCAVDALSSVESVMKTICGSLGIPYDRGAGAADLAKLLKKSDLFPDYLDKSFEQLTATLSSGLPSVRNEAGSHGQGPEIRTVPAYVASYALNLAASKILFLADAFADKERRSK